MRRRQPLPRLWLMTDERQGDRLWRALERLPRGAGVIFRHYTLPDSERRRLFERVQRRARARGLLVIVAGPPQVAAEWGAFASHGRHERAAGRGALTAPVHDLAQIRSAERIGAELLFLSPVFATRSHQQAKPLGPVRFGVLSRQTRLPVIALGGMDRRRARGTPGAYGWAAIDAWTD